MNIELCQCRSKMGCVCQGVVSSKINTQIYLGYMLIEVATTAKQHTASSIYEKLNLKI